MRRLKITIVFTLLLTLYGFLLSAQNDATKITEAQYALKKHPSDCKGAKQALNEVSENGKSSRLYIYYLAKTYDCLDEFDLAITFYTKYLDFVPNDSQIIQRVAELSYKRRKQDNRSNFAGKWKRVLDGELNYYTIDQVNDLVTLKCEDPECLPKSFEGRIYLNGEIRGSKYNTEDNVDFRDDEGYKCKMCWGGRPKAKLLISEDGNTLELWVLERTKQVPIGTKRYETGCCQITENKDYTFWWSITRVL